MNELTAHHTFVGEDAEYELFMVVFAEEEGEQGERLDIQRAFAFDDQDRSLGQDTYCLVSREDLDVDGGYEIRIEAYRDKLEAIRAGLGRA